MVRFPGATLAVLTLISLAAHGQSFDCARAATAVERAICADQALQALDTSLVAAFHDAVASADPGERPELKRQERTWRIERDTRCVQAPPAGGQSLQQCLAALYRERMATLKPGKDADTANCRKIADRYAPLASAHPGETPLTVLRAAPQARITRAEPLTRMADPATHLPRWASQRKPPFVVPQELTQSLISMNEWALDKLPGVDFYALSSVGGTAHCYSSTYFAVVAGRAQPAATPRGFSDEGGACGADRFFGQIDEASVFFEENYNWTPQMSSDVMVATWQDGDFRAACTVTFSFAPKFTEQTFNSWQRGADQSRSCAGPQCAALRRAAFELAAAVQKDPAQARLRWQSQLTAPQSVEFAAAVRLAAADSQSDWDPGQPIDPQQVTDQMPLHLPYVLLGRVYLVSMGHYTIGWRYYADWWIRFQTLEDGKLTARGDFPVGMMKGDLEKVSVTAVH